MATFLERASRLLSSSGGFQSNTPAKHEVRQPRRVRAHVHQRGRHVRVQQTDGAEPSNEAFDAFYDAQLRVNGSPDNGTPYDEADFRPTTCADASSSSCEDYCGRPWSTL